MTLYFGYFDRLAHSETSISFALDKAKSVHTDLIAAKTTNPRVLPTSCTHLQKVLDKYLKNSSEAEASLQFYFIIALEIEKVKSRTAKMIADLDTIFPKLLTELADFLKVLDPDINTAFDPVDIATLKPIFKNIRLEIRSIFLNRQIGHKLQADRRQQQRAVALQQQSEVLTFTRRDFENEVRRVMNASARRPKNGLGRRANRANRDAASSSAPSNRMGRSHRNTAARQQSAQSAPRRRAASITSRRSASANRRPASIDASRPPRRTGHGPNQRRATQQVRGNGRPGERRNMRS